MLKIAPVFLVVAVVAALMTFTGEPSSLTAANMTFIVAIGLFMSTIVFGTIRAATKQ